jgi:hypothetical protein
MALNVPYLRERAKHLRKLAQAARDEPNMKYLIRLAEDFEQEARKLEEFQPE